MTLNLNSPMLSVLLPVRNEGINLRIMLKILRVVLDCPHEVLVVVDNEEDDSIAVVEPLRATYPGLKLVYNKLGRGVVNALRAGVAQASGEYVLLFAADEVGPVLAIDDMLELMNQGCDLVSCTRYAYGGRRLGGSVIGGILSRTANALFHALSRSVLTDSTTGIKMFRRDIFDRLALASPPVGWVVAFEIAIKAQVEGMRLGEVPIVSIDRLYGGKSTFRLGPWFVEYLKLFLWGSRKLWALPAEKRPTVTVRASTYFTPKQTENHEQALPSDGRDGVHRKRHG